MLRCVVGLVLALFGCSGEGFAFDGTPGKPIPVTMGSWVPRAAVIVDGGEPRSMLVDTGAPLTVLDSDSFPSLRPGVNTVDLAGFDMTFPGLPAVVFDAFEASPADDAIDGIVGGDVLRHFTVSVDYQGARVWLDEPGRSELPSGVSPSSVMEPAVVPVTVAGGGLALLPGACTGGCGTVCVPATRVVVPVQLEDSAAPMWMLVDTGASAMVLSTHAVLELGDKGRPRLEGVTVGTANGNAIAYLTRVASVGIGGARQTSVPTLILGGDMFASVSQELGLPVAGLIGGSALRRYLTTIDYHRSELVLAAFVDSSHIDPEEYVRVGFSMKRRDDAWFVGDVYPGTDAEAAGMVPGTRVGEIDGTDISSFDQDAVQALLEQFTLGQRVPVGIQLDTGIDTVSVEVEDLLPHFGGS